MEAAIVAARSGDVEPVKAFAATLTPEVRGSSTLTKNSLMHTAIEAGQFLVVSALLNLGFSPNAGLTDGSFGSDGDTPLHIAALVGDERIATLLLSHGGDPFVRNSKV